MAKANKPAASTTEQAAAPAPNEAPPPALVQPGGALARAQAIPEHLIVPSEAYPVLDIPSDELTTLIQANVGTQPGAIGKFDLPRIRVPTGGVTHWTIETIEGRKNVETLDVIFLYWRDGRAWWEKEYGRGPKGPPDCKSEDGVRGEGRPGGLCINCPLAKFNGDEPPKCKQKRLSFALVNGELMPWTFFVPLMSIDPFKKYLLRLISARKPFWQVVTRLALEPAQNKGGVDYAKVSPSVAGFLDKEQCLKLKGFIDSMTPVFSTVNVDDDEEEIPREVG